MRIKKWQLILILIGFFVGVIFSPTVPDDELLDRIDVELKKYPAHFRKAQFAILIDYDSPVFRKRLWVVDLKSRRTLLNAHVSHAYKSGLLWATEFSNEPESKISSKGVFKTLNAYKSQFGEGEYQIGMRIQGLEPGINDNVFQRNIVFHSHHSPWSEGCFMTLPSINKEIIDLTRDGNLLIVR
ncbi:murein L,D-transpeptidase catalytic domain family protein [bacterium SCSIO 12741]|nr:murein L,D-transpeptidase catalytic domain family protein [bacterium SCSIO 12741]